MNFLALVNELHQEASVAGTGLATVDNVTGENARLVLWIQRAHETIQNKYFDWKFLSKDSTFNTQTNTNIIQPPSDISIWDIKRLFDSNGSKVEFIYYSALGEDSIDPTVLGKPTRFIIKNDNTLLADPYPDAIYTFSYDYFRAPLVLAADTDVPLIPEQYHRAIVGLALMYYGNYESAPELKQQGQEMYMLYFKPLEFHQAPNKQQTYGRSDSVEIQVVAQ